MSASNDSNRENVEKTILIAMMELGDTEGIQPSITIDKLRRRLEEYSVFISNELLWDYVYNSKIRKIIGTNSEGRIFYEDVPVYIVGWNSVGDNSLLHENTVRFCFSGDGMPPFSSYLYVETAAVPSFRKN